MKGKRASSRSQVGQTVPTRTHGCTQAWSPPLPCSLCGFCCLSHHFWAILFKKTHHLSGNHSSAYPTARCPCINPTCRMFSGVPVLATGAQGRGKVNMNSPWNEFPLKTAWWGFKSLIWILLGYEPEQRDLLDKRSRDLLGETNGSEVAGGGCS